MTKRLSSEELSEIAERAEVATGDILADSYVMTARDKLALEDVPKLLAEVERLKKVIEDAQDVMDETGDSNNVHEIRYKLVEVLTND